MITYKNLLTRLTQLDEEIRSKDFNRAAEVIRKYMTKYVGRTYYFPSQEAYTSGGKRGVGIRFFMSNGKSFRLNWERTISSSLGLTSMDYWDGSKVLPPQPTSHVKFDRGESLVRVIPFIKDFLLGNVKEKSGIYFEKEETAGAKALTEAVYTEAEILKTVNNMINAFKVGIQARQQYLEGGKKKYGPKWDEALRAAKEIHPTLFKKQGTSIVISKEDAAKLDAQRILASIVGGDKTSVSFAVSPGAKEVVEVNGASDEDIERMTYEEQLDSLKTGMKLLMSNATNALFLGGRGGTGKTQTVEDMLHAAGREDGDGYFKITGSATPVGIYRILWEHRKDIILFDDSDSALADQEGRNLFKAASDTKKVRKISWMKGGKNFVDPDEFDEDSDDGTLPRFFEFTGKIIFISNLALNKLDPDGALRTRGYVINIDPTNEEIYDFMLKIAEKIPLEVNYNLSKEDRLEVVEVLRSRKIGDKTANLRSLVRGLNTRAGVESQGGSTEEWKKFVRMFA